MVVVWLCMPQLVIIIMSCMTLYLQDHDRNTMDKQSGELPTGVGDEDGTVELTSIRSLSTGDSPPASPADGGAKPSLDSQLSSDNSPDEVAADAIGGEGEGEGEGGGERVKKEGNEGEGGGERVQSAKKEGDERDRGGERVQSAKKEGDEGDRGGERVQSAKKEGDEGDRGRERVQSAKKEGDAGKQGREERERPKRETRQSTQGVLQRPESLEIDDQLAPNLSRVRKSNLRKSRPTPVNTGPTYTCTSPVGEPYDSSGQRRTSSGQECCCIM